MRIIYILLACSILSVYLLWLGRLKQISKKTACICAIISLLLGGSLLLLAVLPGNSFYGPVLTHVDTKDKVIALTFDDGPYPPYTQELLAVLKEKQVPATFFLVGENAVKHPELVQQLKTQGHEIALHANVHQDLLKLDKEQLQANITKGKTALEKISNTKINYMRPPHGFKDWAVMDAIENSGLKAVNWSIIPRDWTNPGVDVITERVLKDAQPGAIVLLHDGDSPKQTASREQTIKAAAIIIDKLREEGYTFVTISELQKRSHT